MIAPDYNPRMPSRPWQRGQRRQRLPLAEKLVSQGRVGQAHNPSRLRCWRLHFQPSSSMRFKNSRVKAETPNPDP